MSLNSAFIAHQIWLQRYASRTANNLSSFVGKMRDEVRDQVNGFGDESRTRTRLSKMLRGLEDALYLVTGDWHDRLLGDLKDLGEYEAGWTARTLKANVEAEFVVPSPTQVWAAAEFNPLSLSNKPVGIVDLLEGWQDTEVSRLVTGVKSGFVQGKPTRDIVKEVVGVGGLADVSERNAATVVRTAVNHVSTQAKEETYRQNDDVVEGYIWVSTLDKRTSTICKARDGMVFELGKGPLPPAHPNCLLGDTLVSTCSRVSNVYKRRYKGVMIDVVTKSGRTITITPNHPVLTRRGWVAAGGLNKFDQLVCARDGVSAVDHEENNIVAEFSELFSAANVSVNPSAVSSCPSTPEHFHGDGSDGEVNIVNIDSLSWNEVKAGLGKHAINDVLPSTTGVYPALHTLSPGDLLAARSYPTPNGLMGGGSEAGDFFGGRSGHTGGLLLAPISESDTLAAEEGIDRARATIQTQMCRDSRSANTRVECVDDSLTVGVAKDNSLRGGESKPPCAKNSTDWFISAAEELPDALNGDFIDGIEFDDVVDLVVREVDTHVYNLENERNWYLSNGIITHNCRSTTAPKVNSDFDFLLVGGKRAARGSDGGMQVGINTNYYDFLKQQPAWFQDEALGPTRGAIFRNAGLSPEEFRSVTVDGFGRPLTLKEMASLDVRVAEYLAKRRNQQD